MSLFASTTPVEELPLVVVAVERAVDRSPDGLTCTPSLEDNHEDNHEDAHRWKGRITRFDALEELQRRREV